MHLAYQERREKMSGFRKVCPPKIQCDNQLGEDFHISSTSSVIAGFIGKKFGKDNIDQGKPTMDSADRIGEPAGELLTTASPSKHTRKRIGNTGIHLHPRSKCYCFAYRAPGGRYRHKSTGVSGKRAALAVRQTFLEQLRQGQLPTDTAKWTVGRAADHFIEYRKAIGRSSNYDSNRLASVKNLLGLKKLEDISNATLESYQATRAKSVENDTINREIRYLATLLKKAKLWDRLKDLYRPLQTEKSVIGKCIAPAHAKHLVDTALANRHWEHLGWCALIALNGGLRGGEIKTLRLGRISLGNQPHLWIAREGTKTDAGARRVPLNAIAAWAMARLVERASLLGSSGPDDYLLPACLSRHTKLHDPLNGRTGHDSGSHQKSLRTVWEAVCAKAKKTWDSTHPDDPFPAIRFHDLRHSFISWAGEQGVPIEKIQAMAGHMSATMTRYYLHLNDKATRTVVDSVGATMAFEVPTGKEGISVLKRVQ
jgi:integrase